LEAKSTLDCSIRVSILGDYLKREKELLAMALERTDKIRGEFASAIKDARPNTQYPGLKDLKYR